jgi:hypothetical protein
MARSVVSEFIANVKSRGFSTAIGHWYVYVARLGVVDQVDICIVPENLVLDLRDSGLSPHLLDDIVGDWKSGWKSGDTLLVSLISSENW